MSDNEVGRKQSSNATGNRRNVPREKGVGSSEMSVYKSSAEESVKYTGSKAKGSYDSTSLRNITDYVGGSKQSNNTTGNRRNVPQEKGTSSSEISVYKSSAEESVKYTGSKAKCFQYICDPCEKAGDHVVAEGFCTDCKEYLCSVCFKNHSRNKASRNHALLDKDNMPKMSVKLCDPCKIAGDEEEPAGYCKDCGEYLCSSCFISHSRNKASRNHVLVDKGKLPEWTDGALTSTVAKLNITERDAESQSYEEKFTYIRDINVKAARDEKNCYITSMTLLNSTELVLCDHNNKSLKLVDLENNVVKDSLAFQTAPLGLTGISTDQVAVALDVTCTIQIVSVSGGLSVVKTWKTGAKCLDVKYINKKLYVSFMEPAHIQILHLTGAVYRMIKLDSEVLKQCDTPRHIAVSLDERKIYISDWETKRFMCINIDGYMISTYQSELDGPGAINISPFGSVYLCNRNKHVVYKMTPDLKNASVILGRGDGLMSPKGMCYNADRQQLYISSGCNIAKHRNVIKSFQCK